MRKESSERTCVSTTSGTSCSPPERSRAAKKRAEQWAMVSDTIDTKAETNSALCELRSETHVLGVRLQKLPFVEMSLVGLRCASSSDGISGFWRRRVLLFLSDGDTGAGSGTTSCVSSGRTSGAGSGATSCVSSGRTRRAGSGATSSVDICEDARHTQTRIRHDSGAAAHIKRGRITFSSGVVFSGWIPSTAFMASVHATFAVRSEGASSTLIQSGESREALRRRGRCGTPENSRRRKTKKPFNKCYWTLDKYSTNTGTLFLTNFGTYNVISSS